MVESRCDLHRALDRLDPEDRELLRLRFAENLTQAELGELMGVSQSYASRVLRSVLDKLRDALEEEPARMSSSVDR